MKKLTLKIFTPILSFVFIFVAFGGLNVSYTSAQENTQENTAETIIIADVNIYDAKIISQENNIFNLSFDIANGEGAQAQIKYAVRLLNIDENGAQSLAHENVYKEEISVSENSQISKTIEYTAPEYLDGTYQLWLIAQNKNGLMLGLSVLGDVNLKGKEGYVEMIPKTCFLRVDGEYSDYTLGQGVDIKKEESLTLYCDTKNSFKKETTVMPTFETRFRSSTGDLAQTGTVESKTITFQPGEQTAISIKLPKALSPQSYHILLTLVNDKGEKISNTVQPHYVLRGASATIQNVILDKDLYKKGDTAKISFMWTPSADSFQDSRFGATDLNDTFLNMSIVDSDGNICAEKIENRKLDNGEFGIVSIKKNITRDCSNPSITASIVDENGNVFDQKDFSVKSIVLEAGEIIPVEQNSKNIIFIVIILIIALLIFIVLRLLTKKDDDSTGNNASNMIMKSIIFLLFVAGGFGMQVEKVDAVTFTVVQVGVAYTANINKTVYLPGETVIVTGNIMSILCTNAGFGFLGGLWVSLSANGGSLIGAKIWGDTLYGTHSFSAPLIPGNYTVSIRGGYVGKVKTWVNDDYGGNWSYVKQWIYGYRTISYTVAAPTPAPTVSLTASPNSITSGNSSTLSWLATDASSCTASGDWTGVKPTSGSSNTGNLSSNKTYTLTCVGAGGSSSDSAIVTVSAPAETDIGLRISDGTKTFIVAVEPLGTLTSPLRVADENGNIYGVILVDPSEPKAIPSYMKVNGIIKALKEL